MARLIRKPGYGYGENIGPGRPFPIATVSDGPYRHSRPRAGTRLRVRFADVATLYLLVLAGLGIAFAAQKSLLFQMQSGPWLAVLCVAALVTVYRRRKRLRELTRDWMPAAVTLAATA